LNLLKKIEKEKYPMPIIDSKTGKIRKDYTVEQLIEKAWEMRAYNMIAITAASSGYTGGTLFIMDITLLPCILKR